MISKIEKIALNLPLSCTKNFRQEFKDNMLKFFKEKESLTCQDILIIGHFDNISENSRKILITSIKSTLDS